MPLCQTGLCRRIGVGFLALGAGFGAGFLAGPLGAARPSTDTFGEVRSLPASALDRRTSSSPGTARSFSSAAMHPSGLVPGPGAAEVQPWARNLAHKDYGSVASGGQQPEALIDGDVTNFDGAAGFAHTDWSVQPPQDLIVAFRESMMVNTVRVLLWDKDDRFYRYKLEASNAAEGGSWDVLADRTREPVECRSWQTISFPPRALRRLRITGTYNSANNGFHVVELQAYFVPGGMPRPWDEMEF